MEDILFLKEQLLSRTSDTFLSVLDVSKRKCIVNGRVSIGKCFTILTSTKILRCLIQKDLSHRQTKRQKETPQDICLASGDGLSFYFSVCYPAYPSSCLIEYVQVCPAMHSSPSPLTETRACR